MLTLRIIGTIELQIDGVATGKFRTKRCSWLLGYLGLTLGTNSSRFDIIEALWPGVDLDVGRNRLSTELSYLRRLAKNPKIVSGDAERIRLDPGVVATDYAELERALSNAADIRAGLGRRIDQFRRAAALLSGPLLPEISEPWAEAARTEIDNRAVATALDLAQQVAEFRGVRSAVPILRTAADRILTSTALHEGLIRLLVQAHAYEEAEVAFDRYRTMLEREYDTEPDFEFERLLAYAKSRPARGKTSADAVRGRLTTFVGRRDDQRRIRRLISGSSVRRLVTILGIGGLGKTRIAEAIAQSELADGREVLWVDLTEVSDGSNVVEEIVRSDKLPLRSAVSARAVGRHLEGRNLLLILDNAEDAVEACGQVLPDLLSTARDTRILATSRLPLRIEGEAVVRLRPLGSRERFFPGEVTEAARLFLDRAEEADARIVQSNDELERIEQICHTVGGIPLAIELVSSFTVVLSTQQILAQLTNLIIDGRVGKRSGLSGALQWSYDSIEPGLKRELRALGAFHGPFDLEAAADVTGSKHVVSSLQSLMAVAFVWTQVDSGIVTYRLLEPVAQYLRSLWTDEERCEVQDRHAIHYGHKAIELGLMTRTANAVEVMDRLEAEYANLLAAIRHLAESDINLAVESIAALRLYWQDRFHYRDVLEILKPLLEAPNLLPAVRAKGHHAAALGGWNVDDHGLMFAQGVLAWHGYHAVGEFAELSLLVRESHIREKIALELGCSVMEGLEYVAEKVESCGDSLAKSAAYLSVAISRLTSQGDLGKLLEELEIAHAHAKACGSPHEMIVFLQEKAYIQLFQSQFRESADTYRQAARIKATMSQRSLAGRIRATSCLPWLITGDYGKVKEEMLKHLKLLRDFGPKPELIEVLQLLSQASEGLGDVEECRAYLIEGYELSCDNMEPFFRFNAERFLGDFENLQGNYHQSERWLALARQTLSKMVNYQIAHVQIAVSWARLFAATGELEQAMANYSVVADWYEQLGYLFGLCMPIFALSLWEGREGRPDRAIELYGLTMNVRVSLGVGMPHQLEKEWAHRVARLYGIELPDEFPKVPSKELRARVMEELARFREIPPVVS